MLHRITQTIEHYRMFERGQSVGVAVSGGADSVCLLHVLLELAPRWELALKVLHLNHMLRGEESRQDAEFVRQLAEGKRLPVVIRDVDVAASPGNLEAAARSARLDFFREQIAGGQAHRVALGHTRSDQAETVLFRLLRGSGTAGLAGIRPVTASGIVRPLIGIERGEVQQFLRHRGISWREDSSNTNLDFARNRIRHELLPQLAREWNPAIGGTLANMADWAQAEEAYWAVEIDRLAALYLTGREDAIFLRVDALLGLPLAAARRLVRRAIECVKSDLRGIDFYHIAAILDLASGRTGTGRLQVPELDICRSFDWLRFSQTAAATAENGYQISAIVPGAIQVPGAHFTISLELIEKAETSQSPDCVYNNNEKGCLDWRRLSGSLELRNWRPGDQYQPWGRMGEEKIKTLFQQARIPLWERRQWPVLTDGSSIVWVRQFGPAAEFAAVSGSKVLLMIREVTVT